MLCSLLPGLPESSLVQLIGGLATENATLIEATPGVNAAIVAAGTEALLSAYLYAFRYLWLTAIPFIAAGILGTSIALASLSA